MKFSHLNGRRGFVAADHVAHRVRTTLVALFFLLTIGPWSPAGAETLAEAITRAIANPHRSDADRARDETSKPAAVLRFMELRPGMHVADVISGGGYWSELMSYIVGPKGKVIAHSVKTYDQWDADERKVRYAAGRLPNVVPLKAELPVMDLGNGSLDLVLLSTVYHDIYYKSDFWTPPDHDDFFARIRKALKPGGVLVVINHVALLGTGNSASQELHRIDATFAKRDIESVEFKFQAASDALRNSDDDHTILAYDEKIRGHTDRFIYRFIER